MPTIALVALIIMAAIWLFVLALIVGAIVTDVLLWLSTWRGD